MLKQDARSLKNDALHERRKQVIRLLEGGESRARIKDMTELSLSAIAKIIRLYQDGGMPALVPEKRGRKHGEERRLSLEQESRAQQLICTSTPEQFQLSYLVWTREAVRQLIEKEFGVLLAVRTVGHYLKRWNFTRKKLSRKPGILKQALPYERSLSPGGEYLHMHGYVFKGKYGKAFREAAQDAPMSPSIAAGNALATNP